MNWKVEKIGVIGPGIVGMPMAGMLAHAGVRIGQDEPARVMVIQRNSENSGWKVGAINAGRSVIGGIEPGLDDIVREAVNNGRLAASHDFTSISDADMILVAVQTDKDGFGPDYGPMMGALDSLCQALKQKPAGKQPVIVFESTLAPSSMTTVIRKKFEEYGMVEGRDIFLGNSPNRVMPGRLVERIRESDKLVAGLHPETPGKITSVYRNIVTKGALLETNSLTGEIAKTLENAYRDVRIAFSAEIVRYCDKNNIDFYQVRNKVNEMVSQTDAASENPNEVPSGGILIPSLGVGGHCLPKDGILLWWRGIEKGLDTSNSLILKSRVINDQSPEKTIRLAESVYGPMNNATVALLGTAYRFNSEDTRNSPTLAAARLLQGMGCRVRLHDPFVKGVDQNLIRFDLTGSFTRDLESALNGADYAILGTAHKQYMEGLETILGYGKTLKGVFDACNLYREDQFGPEGPVYSGIGRGKGTPSNAFIRFVAESFRTAETGLANELNLLIGFLNRHYVNGEFNKVDFREVQRLVGSCSTGCEIQDPGRVASLPDYRGFTCQLAECAYKFDKTPEIPG